MAGPNSKPRYGKGRKRSTSTDELIRQHIGRDPTKLPTDFKKILAEEIGMLRLALSTPKHPFKPGPPWAVESEYVQTGLFDYVFADLDYAIIRYVFDIDDPGKLKKSRLKDRLVNECGVPLAQLEGLSWQDISDFSWSAIERAIVPIATKLAETKPDSTPAQNLNIQNSNVVLGTVQGENVQIGDYASVRKRSEMENKKKGIIKILLKSIAAIVAFLAPLFTCLWYLGWLEPIKLFIYGLFTHR